MSPSEPEAGPEARPEAVAGRGPSRLAPPSPEVVAAIIAAVEATWPRPAPAGGRPRRRSSWRWSGRWWYTEGPVASSRRRP